MHHLRAYDRPTWRPAPREGLISQLGPVFRKSRVLFGPEKSVVKLKTACFESLVFQHVSNKKKTKKKQEDCEVWWLRTWGFWGNNRKWGIQIGPNSILNDSFFLSYRSSDNCGWWPSFTSQVWGWFSKSPENFLALKAIKVWCPCENKKGVVAPKIGPKGLGTFKKRHPTQKCFPRSATVALFCLFVCYNCLIKLSTCVMIDY